MRIGVTSLCTEGCGCSPGLLSDSNHVCELIDEDCPIPTVGRVARCPPTHAEHVRERSLINCEPVLLLPPCLVGYKDFKF
jgi:hypothetical protein